MLLVESLHDRILFPIRRAPSRPVPVNHFLWSRKGRRGRSRRGAIAGSDL